MKVKVIVTLKNGVLDPQGKAIQQTLNGMNFSSVTGVRQGKFFEINVNDENENKEQTIKSNVNRKYDPNKVFIGATLNHRQLGTKVSELFLKDFNYSTPENCAKQARIHPNLTRWDWSLLEDYLAFASKNDITLRIHGPISPQASQWAKDDSRTKEELIENMTTFFTSC